MKAKASPAGSGQTRAPSAEDVDEAARSLGFCLEPVACAGLATYLGLLAKWNRVMNLVGPSSWRRIFDTLIVDSLHLAAFLERAGLPPDPDCRDLGAGAGLPGVPLRLIWRRGAYVLVDSREKRALFLRAVLAACALPGVSVFQGRAEDYLAEHGAGDLVVSRAFMPWQKVLALVEPFSAPGAVCVFLSNHAAPSCLPGLWIGGPQNAYRADGDERFFWTAVRRECAA